MTGKHFESQDTGSGIERLIERAIAIESGSPPVGFREILATDGIRNRYRRGDKDGFLSFWLEESPFHRSDEPKGSLVPPVLTLAYEKGYTKGRNVVLGLAGVENV